MVIQRNGQAFWALQEIRGENSRGRAAVTPNMRITATSIFHIKRKAKSQSPQFLHVWSLGAGAYLQIDKNGRIADNSRSLWDFNKCKKSMRP
jgi:hypothetical protein